MDKFKSVIYKATCMDRYKTFISKATCLIEVIVSIAIIAAIILSFVTVLGGIKDIYLNPQNSATFKAFLGIAFNIIIGVEFLKMIFKTNLDTVLEILLFAIARQLIVEHTTVFENGIGVLSIGVLFLIRKFLYVPQLDAKKEENFD